MALTLDEAWAEAEAALPEGYVLELYWGGPGTEWEGKPDARAGAAAMPMISSGWGRISEHGPTPADALHALAEKLRSDHHD